MSLRIGIITGGGDAPGLNAVIYGLVRSATRLLPPGTQILGFRDGYKGIYNLDYITLDHPATSGILFRGGSILFSNNRDNPHHWKLGTDEDGQPVYGDVSERIVENLRATVDVLVAIGGDGTLTLARDLAARGGVQIIGVPKTIDNDLVVTDATFGFDTAVNVAVENLGRLHTTAESHHRVLIAEIMGRNAGWLTLHAGIAGSADVILLPEFPYEIERVVAKIHSRDALNKRFTIIAVGEGARPKGGAQVVSRIVKDSATSVRLGGVASHLAAELDACIPDDEHEVRYMVFGHTQRGGDASPYDRLLSLRYAYKAISLIADGVYNKVVCLRSSVVTAVDFSELAGATEEDNQRKVQRDSELVQVAKSIGIEFGCDI